jgi:hypothetical protein
LCDSHAATSTVLYTEANLHFLPSVRLERELASKHDQVKELSALFESCIKEIPRDYLQAERPENKQSVYTV